MQHIKRKKLIHKNVFCIVILVVLGSFFGVANVIAQSTTSMSETVTITARVIGTATVPPVTPPPSPTSLNTNGVSLNVESAIDAVVFKGKAYPGAIISVLKNGTIVNELPANTEGTFSIPVHTVTPGVYTFGLFAKDSAGLKSSIVTYSTVVISNVSTEISGIIIPPTITTNKTEVKQGDEIVFSGKSIPNSEVILNLFAKSGITKIAIANASGTWSYVLTTKGLELGDYNLKARAKIGTQDTIYGDTILFTVGTSNKIRKITTSLVGARCDLNDDGRVNLLDFSIMAFWYKRLGFSVRVDLNSDGRINLTDLSILAYCWTG